MLAHPTGITVIAQSLKTSNDKTKILSNNVASRCSTVIAFLNFSIGNIGSTLLDTRWS